MPKEWSFAPRRADRRAAGSSSCAVGCYVPSGRYPLPSTLLMTVIPAQVAGVERIVVVSPKPAKETLAAAAMLGVTSSIASAARRQLRRWPMERRAFARVDKIVGPGNCIS